MLRRSLSVALLVLMSGSCKQGVEPQRASRDGGVSRSATLPPSPGRTPSPPFDFSVGANYGCPDLAAVSLKALLVDRAAPGRGRVRLEGVARNVGSVAWSPQTPSHRIKVSIFRYHPPTGEQVLGGFFSKLVDKLLPGQETRLFGDLNWEKSKTDERLVWALQVEEVDLEDHRYSSTKPAHLKECRDDNNRISIPESELSAALGALTPQAPATANLTVWNVRPRKGSAGETEVDLDIEYDTVERSGRIDATVRPPDEGFASPLYLTAPSGRVSIIVSLTCPSRLPAGASEDVEIEVSLFSSRAAPDATSTGKIPRKKVCSSK